MAEPFNLLVLPGEGIGPEVVDAGLQVFELLWRQEYLQSGLISPDLGGSATTAKICDIILEDLT